MNSPKWWEPRMEESLMTVIMILITSIIMILITSIIVILITSIIVIKVAMNVTVRSCVWLKIAYLWSIQQEKYK